MLITEVIRSECHRMTSAYIGTEEKPLQLITHSAATRERETESSIGIDIYI